MKTDGHLDQGDGSEYRDSQGWREPQGSAFGFLFPFMLSALGHWTFPGTAGGAHRILVIRPFLLLDPSLPHPGPQPPLQGQPSPSYSVDVSPKVQALPVVPPVYCSSLALYSEATLQSHLGRCLFCRCLLQMRFVPKDRTLRIQACRGVFVSGFLMIEKYPKVALPENSLFLGKAPL